MKTINELIGAIVFYASDRADNPANGMTPEYRLSKIRNLLDEAGYGSLLEQFDDI